MASSCNIKDQFHKFFPEMLKCLKNSPALQELPPMQEWVEKVVTIFYKSVLVTHFHVVYIDCWIQLEGRENEPWHGCRGKLHDFQESQSIRRRKDNSYSTWLGCWNGTLFDFLLILLANTYALSVLLFQISVYLSLLLLQLPKYDSFSLCRDHLWHFILLKRNQ